MVGDPYLFSVIKNDIFRGSEYYPASKVRRTFLAAPIEATFAVLKIKSTQTDKAQRFTLHTVQLKPASSVTTYEFYKVYFS